MIRLMTEADLQEVLLLEQDLFPEDPWPMHEYMYELHENPFSKLYVYEEDGKIIGYFDLWITYEQAQVANIGVHREYRQKGIGTFLIQYMQNIAIENECENLTLEVRVSNEKAIRLYEKTGFITVATRHRYYSDGEDAYLMIKPIGGLEYDNAVGDRIEL